MLALVLVTLLAGAPVMAQAADPAQVEELIRQGVDLRRKGKDQHAVPLFQKAYDLERSARTAAQLGLAEAAMGYWIAADRHLTEALAFDRNPWVMRNRGELDRALAQVRTYIGELEVTGTPAGAEVLVNGKPVGRLPLATPVRLAEGPAQIGLRAPGHVSASTSVKVAGGKRDTLRLSLKPGQDPSDDSAAAVTPPPVGSPDPGRTSKARAQDAPAVLPSSAGAASSSGEPATLAGRAPAASAPPGWLRPAAWAATVGAAVALGAGGYGLVTQHARKKDFDEYRDPDTRQLACATELRGKGGKRCLTLFNQARNAETLAIAGFAAGGALAAGAVVAFILSSGDAPHGRVAFTAAPQPGGAELGWRLRF